MTKITELEKAVLINIAENQYTESNGAVPQSTDDCMGVWTDCVEDGPVDGPTGKSLSGVMSSLTQKKLIDNMDDADGNQTWLTDEGFKVYQTFNRVD